MSSLLVMCKVIIKCNACACAQVAVTDKSGLLQLTQQALARRTAESTGSGAASDRSNCLITLAVQRHLPCGSVIHGKLTLIDLAGKLSTLCIRPC